MAESLFKQYEGVFGEEEERPKKGGAPEYAYNPFPLQDAIGQANVKKIWIEYQRLILSGVEVDDLIHKMISKVRDMLAIKRGAGQADLGISKEYTYNKSKRDFINWKEDELEKFYCDLVSLYHSIRLPSGRSGKPLELGAALERTLLSIGI